jgi:tetrahydromethanopterin S-methyltransferase subunit B
MSSLFKDIAAPISETVKGLHGDLVNNFKSIEFSHSNLRSLQSDILPSISESHLSVKGLREISSARELHTAPESNTLAVVEQVLASVQNVIAALPQTIELSVVKVLSRNQLDSHQHDIDELSGKLDKLVQVVQGLDEKIANINHQLSTLPMSEGIHQVRQQLNDLSVQIESHKGSELSTDACNKIVFTLQQIIEKQMESFKSLTLAKINKVCCKQGPESVHGSDIEQKIDESGKGH